MSPDWLPRRDFEQFRKDVIEPMREDLKNVCLKQDLDYQTKILTTRIDASEKSLSERDAQKWKTIQLMFWSLGGIGTVLGVISLIITLAKHGGN